MCFSANRHLPLFRAPHDRQIVLRVRLADPEPDPAVREQMHGKLGLWTIEPERFELPRLGHESSNPLRSFGADVFSGHFERAGKRAHAKARCVVERGIPYRKLDPAARVRGGSRCLSVGRYLVKEIDSRPDVDHIAALSAPAAGPLTIRKAGMDNPEARIKSLAPVRGTGYFETGDLR